MFWWYWSLRQRLMLLFAVLVPVAGFFAFRVLLSTESTSSPGTTVPHSGSSTLPEASSSKSQILVLADSDARSAARVFPDAFGSFGEGSVQTKNMVFPGMATDEYSVYLFFRTIATDSPVVEGGESTSTTAPAASVPLTPEDTTAQTVLESLKWRFTERGAAVRAIESRAGTELFVAGLEGSRGYQTTLRFQEVPGGVVVRGLVKEIPANEVNDLAADAESAPGEEPAEDSAAPTSTVPTSVTTTGP